MQNEQVDFRAKKLSEFSYSIVKRYTCICLLVAVVRILRRLLILHLGEILQRRVKLMISRRGRRRGFVVALVAAGDGAV